MTVYTVHKIISSMYLRHWTIFCLFKADLLVCAIGLSWTFFTRCGVFKSNIAVVCRLLTYLLLCLWRHNIQRGGWAHHQWRRVSGDEESKRTQEQLPRTLWWTTQRQGWGPVLSEARWPVQAATNTRWTRIRFICTRSSVYWGQWLVIKGHRSVIGQYSVQYQRWKWISGAERAYIVTHNCAINFFYWKFNRTMLVIMN